MADNWQLKAVLSAVDKMSPILKGVGNVAKTTRKYLADVGTAANTLTGKIGLPLTMLSGVIGGFSIGALKNAVVGFTEMGEAAYKGALRSGMSVEEWVRMKYVAEQAGVGVEALEGSLGKLNRNVGEAASGGNTKLASLFAKLHISMRGTNGEVRSGVEMLPELADAFQRNTNAATRARIGVALFGKSWQEIAPMLAEGSDDIKASLDRFVQLRGSGLNKQTAKDAKDLGDKFSDLGWAVKGFQNTVAKELVPILSPLVEDIIQWAAANRKLISVEVKAYVKDLVEWLRQIDWAGIVESVKDFAKSLGKLVDEIGGAKNALIALVFWMNIPTIKAILGLMASIGRLGWAFTAFALKSIPKVLSALGLYEAETVIAAGTTDVLAASTKAADAAATGWLKNLKSIGGVLGQIAIAAAPLAVMWGVKEWAGDPNDHETNVKSGERASWMQDNLGNSANSFLSIFGFDKNADIERRRAANRAELDGSSEYQGAVRPSLLAPPTRVNASGAIEISFKDMLPGMRVEQTKTGGDVPINTSVGYRSYATGMP